MRVATQAQARDVRMFTRDNSDSEIKAILLEMEENKALGLDGFNALFFKSTWEVIGREFVGQEAVFLQRQQIIPSDKWINKLKFYL